MKKKITVVIDDMIIKKLHEKQAKLIKNSTKFVSFSSVVNDVLRQSLKQFPK